MAYEPAPLPPEPDRCSACGGTGWLRAESGVTSEQPGEWQECGQCLGTGRQDQRGRKQPLPDPPPTKD